MKNKYKFILVALALLFLGLITLGIRSRYLDSSVTSGIITHKYHRNEHYYIHYIRVGKGFVPQIHHVPEDYGIVVTGKDYSGNDRAISISSYDMYLHTNIGDSWHK
jgi:hypothetical protein